MVSPSITRPIGCKSESHRDLTIHVSPQISSIYKIPRFSLTPWDVSLFVITCFWFYDTQQKSVLIPKTINNPLSTPYFYNSVIIFSYRR